MKKSEAHKVTLPFGKYKGEMLKYIIEYDINYAYWLTTICTFGILNAALLVLHDDIKEAYQEEKFNSDDWDDVVFDF